MFNFIKCFFNHRVGETAAVEGRGWGLCAAGNRRSTMWQKCGRQFHHQGHHVTGDPVPHLRLWPTQPKHRRNTTNKYGCLTTSTRTTLRERCRGNRTGNDERPPPPPPPPPRNSTTPPRRTERGCGTTTNHQRSPDTACRTPLKSPSISSGNAA